MNLIWKIKPFHSLTPEELYGIMHLRAKVFVVEQKCIFNDIDGKDEMSHHVFAYSPEYKSENNISLPILACSRIVPPGIAYKELSIGRVSTDITVRRLGIGKELMKRSIEFVKTTYPNQPIRIGAQLYLKRFYESYGFIQDSVEYIEDDILHIEMIAQKI
jgi:ElaA protein